MEKIIIQAVQNAVAVAMDKMAEMVERMMSDRN